MSAGTYSEEHAARSAALRVRSRVYQLVRAYSSETHALDACSNYRHGLLLECRLGGGRVPRRRVAHERLPHGRARRLRVWLHAGEWADTRCARAVLMLDRCHRFASSL